MLPPRQETPHRTYATHADFCRIFTENMKSLYLLAFLLTANHRQAEQCFVSGIAEVVEGNPVFAKWARSWSRWIIVKNAARIVAPASSQTDASRDLWDEAESKSAASLAIDGITRLDPLERFAFVFSVLERYRDVECAMLLGCRREDVIQARIRALQNLVALVSQQKLTPVVPLSLSANALGLLSVELCLFILNCACLFLNCARL